MISAWVFVAVVVAAAGVVLVVVGVVVGDITADAVLLVVAFQGFILFFNFPESYANLDSTRQKKTLKDDSRASFFIQFFDLKTDFA